MADCDLPTWGLPGGVGAAGLQTFPGGLGLELEVLGIWGKDRPGEDLEGEPGLLRREGSTGLGLAGILVGLVGEGVLLPPICPFLKGLLETSLC